MERLTQKQSAGYDLIKMNGEWCNTYCNNQPAQTCRDCTIYEAINKLAKYENSLLEPEEVKELILDICRENYQKWYEKLSNLLRENYDNAK